MRARIGILGLSKEGFRPRDKVLIFVSLILLDPVGKIKRRLGWTYLPGRLAGKVVLKNDYGTLYCGDDLTRVWIASTRSEPTLAKFFDMDQGVFVDVGANIGKYTVMVARKLGSRGKVVAIEPEPENFRLLQKNIELNGLTNVIPVRLACFEKNGPANLYIDSANPGGHSIMTSDAMPMGHTIHDDNKSIEVDGDTLDHILQEFALGPISLIKIDVEGAEARVLAGATSTLERRPKLIFEAWDDARLARISRILMCLGYRIDRIDKQNYFAECELQ